ncbi:dihydroxyacetone kinase phosphoryl donor subunit DhaM [Paenactinomyces guangxiensis]|uniref:phosphoenolpyruvate--glycerone phosphotransferase n=1 Tax=Paenactinomyces guangxiensis TaxID=1490290 RepID=A0A7W2A7K7_9BACL|nr:dihydroxyacetone kinase phosphoryl donor subunit DhaM [Paenactinomyces guangxiensis]MBA4494671.1 PTS-dependent dihydroxyacetone kinase phosphotransferase subunit DhaM [Paenactinomyces guangxiensis]MBH8591755.1 PTS-dependent dihydroxyacetone kinase phosphotransferase subunit DhaM [Paenactinomyces guangxiensis]
MSYVGIVLVSHSRVLVEGLREFLRQVQSEVPIAVAGGTDEDELGTSAVRIKEAIESVCTDRGVVVLFDIGSALMNTEMAIEWLEQNKKVKIADAPLVEGSYAAVVESGCGSGLDKVLNSAEKAKTLVKLL